MDRLREQLKWLHQIIYFDENHYLREKANDDDILQELIDEAENTLINAEHRDAKYFLMGTLGNLYRIKEEPLKAISYLEQALDLTSPNSTEEIVTLIRLGEAYKYNGELDYALKLFDQALLLGYEYEPSYIDFAYQHKGKCLMEMGRPSEAIDAFQEALAVRKSKKEPALIASTEQAINYVKQHFNL